MVMADWWRALVSWTAKVTDQALAVCIEAGEKRLPRSLVPWLLAPGWARLWIGLEGDISASPSIVEREGSFSFDKIRADRLRGTHDAGRDVGEFAAHAVPLRAFESVYP
jgi:hypothetical protein